MSIKKMLLKLEDKKMPLLGPNVKAAKFYGLLLPESNSRKLLYILLYSASLLLVVLEWIQFWRVKTNVNEMLTNLMNSLSTSVSNYKVFTMFRTQKPWREIIQYVTRTDIVSRNDDDEFCNKIANSYTRYCRKFTYLYWFIIYCVGLVMLVQSLLPLIMYSSSKSYRRRVKNGTLAMEHAFSFWVPFDMHHNIVGYTVGAIHEISIEFYGSGTITSFDAIAIVIMVFIRGELQILRRLGSTIFDDDDNAVIKRKLIEFQRRQADLIKFTDMFNDCLSPVMFVYFLVASFTVCASFYQIITVPDPSQKLVKLHLLIFALSQLFIYCWHGNNVTHQSGDPMLGLYESAWWKKPIYRRELIILMMQSDKIIVFTAGPNIVLTMETFVNILKGGYSYYTLSREYTK